MDPTVALTNLNRALDDGDLDAARDAFEALDGWLSRGGFLPEQWRQFRDAE